jgi:hypothetical protein
MLYYLLDVELGSLLCSVVRHRQHADVPFEVNSLPIANRIKGLASGTADLCVASKSRVRLC